LSFKAVFTVRKTELIQRKFMTRTTITLLIVSPDHAPDEWGKKLEVLDVFLLEELSKINQSTMRLYMRILTSEEAKSFAAI